MTESESSAGPARVPPHARARRELLRRGGPQPWLTDPPPRPIVGKFIPFALRAVGWLPLRIAHALGALSGAAASLLPLEERRVTDANLRIAFPELDKRTRRRLRRESMAHTGRTFAEMGAIWTWEREPVMGLARKVTGEGRLRETLRQGRGVLIALPHLGSWEFIGPYCSVQYPMTALYRAPRIRELEAFLRSARERHGARLVPAGASAVRALRRALKRGELAAILPDQDAGAGVGIFVPFFGLLANTMVLLPRLAATGDCSVFIAYAERLPRGQGFHVHFVPASEEIYDSDLERSAASLNRDIERCVRVLPEQYLWSYKRFRMRPPGMGGNYRTGFDGQTK